jgi:dipeptidyl aminopeptidase/acylaminoacyl peptidase
MIRSRTSKASPQGATALLLVFAALTLAACGGSSTSASSSATAAPSPAPDSALATASTGAAPLPAPTATGTIAFSKVVSGTGSLGELSTVRADGEGLTQLAAGGEVSFKQPAWSPDGTRIAYILGNSSVRPWSYYPYSVWTMNADGTGQIKLTKGKMRGSWPTWSPDGKQIAFVRALPPAQGDGIYVMNADGSALRRLTDGDAPHWAPNGAIYFAGGVPSDVFRINADGSGLRQVTKGVEVGAFAVSQDGKQLAVYDSFVDQIVTLPATGAGSPVVVVDQVAAKGYVPTHNGLPFGVALSWAPDGRALAFATSDMDDSAGSALYIVSADGSGLSAVPDTGGVWDPAWRPE